MNVFIAGGGRVGFHLARLLSRDRQDVTVIEADQDQVDQIDYALDVKTIRGDGSSVMMLQSVGAASAELFVASMGNDEKNLIAAATAKGLGAQVSVARVDNPMYLESQMLYETVLGIDYILSPDALAALEIANFIQHPGVVASEDFGRGLVQLRQVRVERSPTRGGKTIKDVIAPGSGVLMGVVDRKGQSFIPHGDSIIEPGDFVTLIGHKNKLPSIQKMFHGDETRVRRVAIMGGSTIGKRVAKALEGKVKSVKLFERREDRCVSLSADLDKTKVVARDASSRVSLEQEHVDDVDVFVSATRDDERNIMAGVLAKEVGAKNVVAVINQPDFAPLVSRLGIDYAVTPRASIANRILKLAHQRQFTALAVLDEGEIEVLEFALGQHSTVLGRALKDISPKLPRDTLIATIIRGDKVIVPGGEDKLLAGDSVVLIADADAVDQARKILQK